MKTVTEQTCYTAGGAVLGALAKQPFTPGPGSSPPLAAQVGSAMGAAAASGAGVGGHHRGQDRGGGGQGRGSSRGSGSAAPP